MTTRARVGAAVLVLCLVIAAVVLYTQRRSAEPGPVRDTVAQRDARWARAPAVEDNGGAERVAPAMRGPTQIAVPRAADRTRPEPRDQTQEALHGGAELIEGRRAEAGRAREELVRNLPRPGDQQGGSTDATGGHPNGISDEMAQEAGLPAGTRFAAPLAQTTASLDGTTPIVENKTEHEVDGGIYFPPDAQLAYPNRSGVQGDAGTVALWVEPVDWAGGDASVHSLFRINDPEQRGYRFHLLKDASDLRFQFVTENGETNLRVPIDSWQTGEGHYVAATWGDARLRLYVDGVPLSEQSYEGTLNVTPVAPGWWGSNNPNGTPGAGAILKNTLVADRPFSDAEIQSLWEGH